LHQVSITPKQLNEKAAKTEVSLMYGEISMTLQELQQAIYQLSTEEQLSLLATIIQALNVRQQPVVDRYALVNQLRGCLKKSGQPAPTDADIEAMREERLVEKYLI
jgi:hypothetical protein